MEYQNTVLCHGYIGKLEPCEHINKCKLRTGPYVDESGNEAYVIGCGVAGFKCKRDNPNYGSLTESW